MLAWIRLLICGRQQQENESLKNNIDLDKTARGFTVAKVQPAIGQHTEMHVNVNSATEEQEQEQEQGKAQGQTLALAHGLTLPDATGERGLVRNQQDASSAHNRIEIRSAVASRLEAIGASGYIPLHSFDDQSYRAIDDDDWMDEIPGYRTRFTVRPSQSIAGWITLNDIRLAGKVLYENADTDANSTSGRHGQGPRAGAPSSLLLSCSTPRMFLQLDRWHGQLIRLDRLITELYAEKPLLVTRNTRRSACALVFESHHLRLLSDVRLSHFRFDLDSDQQQQQQQRQRQLLLPDDFPHIANDRCNCSDCAFCTCSVCLRTVKECVRFNSRAVIVLP